MEPTDMTVRILEEIREEIRSLRGEQREFHREQREFQQQTMARFEVIENTLRDLAQQLVMLARGVKVAVESRQANDGRFAVIEKRLAALERPAAT